MSILIPSDLIPFADIDEAKAWEMITDAESMAALAAPCIASNEFLMDTTFMGALKAILRGAVLRWNDTGTGSITQVGAGSFQQTTDTRQQRRSMFWPSEIEDLRNLCAQFSGSRSEVFAIDTAPIQAGATLASRPDLWFQWAHLTPPDAP